MLRIAWLALAATASAAQPSLLDQAKQAMEAQQYAAAEADYRKALAEDPNSAPLLTDLGLSLQMQGRSAEAMRYYSMALKLRYTPETYALLAEEKCRMGELDEAKPMLDKLFRNERQNLRVASTVAPCYLDIDEPVESAILYQSLVASADYPRDLALVQLGKSYMRSGQMFAALLSKSPDGEPYLAALRQASSQGSDGARSAFAHAEKQSPNFSARLSWSEAVARWRQHPDDTALLYLLSVLSAEEGMKQIEACSEQFPASPYVEEFHADMLADQGRAEEAQSEYEHLMREHPDLSELRYNLGLLHEKRQEWEAAANAFRRQLEAFPRDERAAAHLSRCLLEMQQYAALREFLKPRMSAPHPPQWASLNLAEVEQKLGNTAAAIAILSAAEHEPNADKLVHYRLMHLYTIAGRSADAKREFALFQAASKSQQIISR
jgi:superkiller protein 3